MSENRDEATGQFAESGANLTGEAYETHKAGYVPKPEEPAEKGPEEAKEIADSLAEMRGTPEPEPATEPAEPEDPDAPKEALTQRQLVEELSDRRLLHEINVERRGHEEVAEYADALRAHLNGIDVAAEAKAEQQPAQAAEQTAKVEEPAAVEGLDPELAKALQHPQVREAVEAQFSEANKVREQYSAALETARVSTLATLAEVVPHLAGLPPQQFEEGLALLSQVDPPAFNKAMNILGRAHAITQAQQRGRAAVLERATTSKTARPQSQQPDSSFRLPISGLQQFADNPMRVARFRNEPSYRSPNGRSTRTRMHSAQGDQSLARYRACPQLQCGPPTFHDRHKK
jgi:hypothetical protein